jgi:hypothetical protein
MGGEDHGRALFERVADARERGFDALIARDFAGLGKRNVEIHADEDALVLEIKILDRAVRHGNVPI